MAINVAWNAERAVEYGFVPENVEKFGEWFRVCSECGHKHSLRMVGMMFLHQLRHHPEAHAEACKKLTARMDALMAAYEKVQG